MKKHFNKLSIIFILMFLLTSCSGRTQNDFDNGFLSSADKSESYTDDGWMGESSPDTEYKEEPSSELTENDLANRKLIKTVYLTMQTKEFDRLKTMLDELIPAFGGYVQESDFYAPQREGRYRSYNLTIRIPADNLQGFVDKVGLLGAITNKSEKVEDVTLTYIDMTAYKEALEVEYNKILELLEKAVDLDQILILESKLSELRYEINSYESKLRAYDNLVSYSTVHITINEVEYETVVQDTIASRISSGFMQSLYSVRDFFVILLVFFIGNLPVFVVLIFFLFLFIFTLKKIIRRKQTKAPKGNRFKKSPKISNDMPEDPSEL